LPEPACPSIAMLRMLSVSCDLKETFIEAPPVVLYFCGLDGPLLVARSAAARLSARSLR